MSYKWRLRLVLIIFFLMSGGLVARLFTLQVIRHDHYQALAKDQHQIYKELLPERGEIRMLDLSQTEERSPLAVDKKFQQVYLVPRDIPSEKKKELTEKLVRILDLNESFVKRKIEKEDDPYELLKHKVSEDEVNLIKEIKIKGVGTLPETWRYYPYESLASHMVGFVSRQNKKREGQYGLEKSFQEELSGKAGVVRGQKDTGGFHIPSAEGEFRPAVDGDDLVLTIDKNIQFKAEKELKQAVEKYEAEGGSIIVMNPQTGAVRAMASLPAFNPNHYNEVEEMGVFLNPAVQKVYEPGSVFKPITMAAALDSGTVTPQTTYEDKGSVQIDDRAVENVDGKAYGEQNMTQVLEKSLNTGAVFLQQELDKKDFQSYIQRFNFGGKTGVKLPGEVTGNILNLFSNRRVDLANISFGQGISVTPLGLTTAISAIANKGKMMQPFIVKKRINPKGEDFIKEVQVKRDVISEETAHELTKMLISVVDNGFGSGAKVEGYNIAGKTGTAQVPSSEEEGYSEDTIHSFIGYGPAFDPRFIILVKLDKPKDVRFSSESVAPVFKDMAEYLLNYFEIPPK